ncbi:MAG: hypothetical protein HY053_00960 [Proteobacteria bacterium]|nr:hypothetical protein [Pseudomonadota bacterium]
MQLLLALHAHPATVYISSTFFDYSREEKMVSSYARGLVTALMIPVMGAGNVTQVAAQTALKAPPPAAAGSIVHQAQQAPGKPPWPGIWKGNWSNKAHVIYILQDGRKVLGKFPAYGYSDDAAGLKFARDMNRKRAEQVANEYGAPVIGIERKPGAKIGALDVSTVITERDPVLPGNREPVPVAPRGSGHRSEAPATRAAPAAPSASTEGLQPCHTFAIGRRRGQPCVGRDGSPREITNIQGGKVFTRPAGPAR